MKDYHVCFIRPDSIFHDWTFVYGVNNRAEAVKAVKEHYGSRTKIVSAKAVSA